MKRTFLPLFALCCVMALRSSPVSGQVEIVPRCQSDDQCGDGDLCTTDYCADGICQHTSPDCDDGDDCTTDVCNRELGCSHVNECSGACDHASASVATLWPPDHKLVAVGVKGVTDPQGNPLKITVTGIRQDEPTNTVGDGNTCPDAKGVGTATAWLRAERTGTPKVPGNGRVYHIAFTADGPNGQHCSGVVTACVPHDQGGKARCLDDGPRYDALTCN